MVIGFVAGAASVFVVIMCVYDLITFYDYCSGYFWSSCFFLVVVDGLSVVYEKKGILGRF
jgi:hypothetical protein